MSLTAPATPAVREDRFWRWVTFTPAALLLLAFSVLPILNLIAVSFLDVQWSGGRAIISGVGPAHYVALPADELFRAGVRDTLVFAAFAVAGQMLLGFALALLTSRVTRGRILYRTVFILPILIPGIVIGAIWMLCSSRISG
jgi:multiple sugar transport system permease protein